MEEGFFEKVEAQVSSLDPSNSTSSCFAIQLWWEIPPLKSEVQPSQSCRARVEKESRARSRAYLRVKEWFSKRVEAQVLSLNPSNSTKRKSGTAPKKMGIKVSIKTHPSPSIAGEEPCGFR